MRDSITPGMCASKLPHTNLSQNTAFLYLFWRLVQTTKLVGIFHFHYLICSFGSVLLWYNIFGRNHTNGHALFVLYLDCGYKPSCNCPVACLQGGLLSSGGMIPLPNLYAYHRLNEFLWKRPQRDRDPVGFFIFEPFFQPVDSAPLTRFSRDSNYSLLTWGPGKHTAGVWCNSFYRNI